MPAGGTAGRDASTYERGGRSHTLPCASACASSPGGTTIAAIRELEQAGVRAAFLNAIQAAMQRSKELAKG